MTYTAAEAARVARAQVGYRETGTNDTKYNRWLGTIPGYPEGGYGYPWCASSQSWIASKAGGRANVDYPKTAGCEVAVAWFKAHNRWGGKTPTVGSWVFYGPGGGTHVELVIGVTASTIVTAGGNTTGVLGGKYFNGDGFYIKTVSRSSSRIYGYGRPAYSTTQEDDVSAKDVWNQDGIIPSPPWIAEKGNKFWTASSYLQWLYRNQAKQTEQIAAQNAAIGELTKTVAALAANPSAIDVDALVGRINDAISSVVVRLDTGAEGT